MVNGARGHATALIEGYVGVSFGSTVAGTLTNFGTIWGHGGTAVELDAGAVLAVEAGSTFIGAVVGNGGTLDLASGVGTITGLLSATGAVTVSGSIDNTTFDDFATVEVAAGARFTSPGNSDLTKGARLIALGSLTVTGAVTSAGFIESSGVGVLTVVGALANAGTIYAAGGLVSLEGAVTGAGKMEVKAGVIDLGGTFTGAVTFVPGATGELELAHAQTYTGAVSGFSLTGATRLDLRDIVFATGTTTATFAGTATGGTLTVTSGAEVAKIKLVGDYLTSVFTPSSDGHDGTMIVDPWAAASAHRFIAASANLGGGPSGHAEFSPVPRASADFALLGTRAAIA